MCPSWDDLSESGELFRALAEIASDGILVIDTEGYIQFANPVIQNIFCYVAEELKGQLVTLLMPPKLAQRYRTFFAQHLQTKARNLDWKSIKLEGLRKDGTIVPIEASLREIQGTRHLFTGFVRDISERPTNEQRLREEEVALRASRERLHFVTHAVPALLSYLDTQNRYEFVNQAYERWFGIPTEQFIGKHLTDVIGVRAYQQLQPSIEKALAGEE